MASQMPRSASISSFCNSCGAFWLGAQAENVPSRSVHASSRLRDIITQQISGLCESAVAVTLRRHMRGKVIGWLGILFCGCSLAGFVPASGTAAEASQYRLLHKVTLGG